MTDALSPQNYLLIDSDEECAAFDFFAPLKQRLTIPESILATGDDVSLNPWINGGWRMRVKLPSGRYKYRYFIKGRWRSRSCTK